MKKILTILFLFGFINGYNQNITGRFGSQTTATAIYNLVPDSSSALPTTLTFTPTRPAMRFNTVKGLMEVYNGSVWKDQLGSTYSAKNLGFTGSGDKAPALNTLMAGSQPSISFDDGTATPINSTYNAKGKINEVKNGSTFTGTGRINNILIQASPTQKIFNGVKVDSLLNQDIYVAWWGWSEAPGVDNSPSIKAAIAAAADYATVWLPRNSLGGISYVDSTITINKRVSIRGEGGLFYPKTALQFREGIPSFVVNVSAYQGETGLNIENLKVSQNLSGAPVSTAHAFVINSLVYFRNVWVSTAGGDGFHISAYSGTSSSDQSTFDYCHANFCRNGFYAEGDEANIIVYNNIWASENRQWGFYGADLLGGALYSPHFALNGGNNSVAVLYGGSTYTGINQIGVTNINHKPSLSPTYWQIAPTSIGTSLSNPWDSTKNYVSGGSYFIINDNAKYTIVNPYTETYQGLGRLNSRSLKLNGQDQAGTTGGINLNVFENILQCNGGFATGGIITAGDDMRTYGDFYAGGAAKGIWLPSVNGGQKAYGFIAYDTYMDWHWGGVARMGFDNAGGWYWYSPKHFTGGSDQVLVRNSSSQQIGYRTYPELASDLVSGGSIELTANKATDFTTINNTKYPTTQATVDYVNAVRISATGTFDQSSIAAGGNNLDDVSVSGAAVGDVVVIAQNKLQPSLVYTAWVESAGTVRVRTQNISTSAIDPPSYTFKIIVLK